MASCHELLSLFATGMHLKHALIDFSLSFFHALRLIAFQDFDGQKMYALSDYPALELIEMSK